MSSNSLVTPDHIASPMPVGKAAAGEQAARARTSPDRIWLSVALPPAGRSSTPATTTPRGQYGYFTFGGFTSTTSRTRGSRPASPPTSSIR